MKVLVADGETGLCSEEVAQFLDRVLVQLKTKAPGEHAQMVERHPELLRRLLLRLVLLHERHARRKRRQDSLRLFVVGRVIFRSQS